VAAPCPFLEKAEYLGFKHGARRWRSTDGQQLYTWDALHGEVEVFNTRGRHLGARDPADGRFVKRAVKGRRIDV
jgi:hypothetical protein